MHFFVPIIPIFDIFFSFFFKKSNLIEHVFLTNKINRIAKMKYKSHIVEFTISSLSLAFIRIRVQFYFLFFALSRSCEYIAEHFALDLERCKSVFFSFFLYLHDEFVIVFFIYFFFFLSNSTYRIRQLLFAASFRLLFFCRLLMLMFYCIQQFLI